MSVFSFAVLFASLLLPLNLSTAVTSKATSGKNHAVAAVPSADPTPTGSAGHAEAPHRAETLDQVMLIVGVTMLFILLLLNVIIPRPTPSQFFSFRVILALAAAAFSVAVPGFLALDIGYGIRATGGLAVFVLVYVVNPNRLVKSESPSGVTPS